MKETKRTFNEMVAEGELDELLLATRKLCNHKLHTQNVKLPNYIDEEDVMQDAMLKVFKAYKKFDSCKATANTYFTQIIENTIIDHIRHSWTQPTLQGFSGLHDTYCAEIITYCTGETSVSSSTERSNKKVEIQHLSHNLTDEISEYKLFTKMIADLEDKLTPREQKILKLRYAGYTHQEIADKMGVSRPTVAKDWLRVRKIVLKWFD